MSFGIVLWIFYEYMKTPPPLDEGGVWACCRMEVEGLDCHDNRDGRWNCQAYPPNCHGSPRNCHGPAQNCHGTAQNPQPLVFIALKNAPPQWGVAFSINLLFS
ncbi:hypothetical protein OXB_1800 [Bacillus sp. OxB-1]|nr:hypothetical protein OXB_1800 [Bacillus sp. OxB-1]